MHRYSHLFSTIHDERAPVGALGRGVHYSILRAVLWHADDGPRFHDFAVIWDEDHDTRIIWTAEQLYVQGMLSEVLAIGERKGSVTALTVTPASRLFATALDSITQENPGDAFESSTGTLSDPDGIISDLEDRVRPYLAGINALWQLGPKPIVLRSLP